jgi:two-component SAPR family response regulator
MSRKRIIIVNNDIHILRLLKQNAKKFSPYSEISVATSGSMALGYIQKHNPVKAFDLLVTDYNLPSMNGLDLAQTVRQTWPNMRIVLIVTPGEISGLKDSFGSLNFDGYMQKPLKMDVFQEMLQLA